MNWFNSRLYHSCVVQRDAGTARTLSGEVTASWADSGTRRPCRYAERTERFVSERDAAITTFSHILLMAGTSDVNIGDRIVRIWDEDDVTINAGPFSVEEVLTRRRANGKVHHKSLRLEIVNTS